MGSIAQPKRYYLSERLEVEIIKRELPERTMVKAKLAGNDFLIKIECVF